MNGKEYAGLGRRIRDIKRQALDSMEMLVQQAAAKLEGNGITVYVAQSACQAGEYIVSLTDRGSPVLLSGTGADRELGLCHLLSSRGRTAIDAGLANRALRELGLPPRHPLAPLSGYEEDQIRRKLESLYGEKWISSEKWREDHYSLLARATAGITGCTALAAREGVILIGEHRENAHLASTLPPVHVVVAGFDKVVPSTAEALLVARGVSFYGAGKTTTRNLFFISGPSATADIQGLIVKGMHGPREVHVILLDNGRTSALGNERDLLMCIECGRCLGSCPVYLEKGPVFPENREAPFNTFWLKTIFP